MIVCYRVAIESPIRSSCGNLTHTIPLLSPIGSQCSIINILLGGWLYITTTHLHFHTFLQMTSDPLTIPYTQVKSIAKAKFAKILDNSLQVSTKDGKSYRFTHFLHRDNVYSIFITEIRGDLTV
jgi:hypothetical protein